ncbi:hypothetical protein [Natrinema salaciae]|uniref:Uncharacterized protein n=1 Tax=Natrinema salaciae TaxID=1186196 RepID=A0A1H9IZX7_9EURY|nr:hypothetical protein [Natrinema salaciae]SEQ80037.1 hypothetical protein SAMN04489841_2389 [Natrinema salaciae]
MSDGRKPVGRDAQHESNEPRFETSGGSTTTRRRVLGGIAAGVALGSVVGSVSAEDNIVTGPVAEFGTETASQPQRAFWHEVEFEEEYDDPVVVMKPLTHNGPHECHIRLRNVASTGFEFKIEEWLYRPGRHANEETMHWVVMERGVHTLPDGSRIVAGHMDGIDHEWQTAYFGHAFDETPVVLAQPQTFRSEFPIVSRQRNLGTASVEWRVQRELAEREEHPAERIGAIVMEPGTASLYGTSFEMGTVDGVDHTRTRVGFDGTYQEPRFMADMQTFNDDQPAGLRYSDLLSSSVRVFVEQERSVEGRPVDDPETVGYMTVEGATSGSAALSRSEAADVTSRYGSRGISTGE